MASSASADDTRPVTDNNKQFKILLIDDEPDFADLIATELESREKMFSIETARGAQSGLAIINERPPDCIIADYDMTKMDGIELLKKIREEHPERPYILYTGEGNETIASQAISAGVTDYLTKSADQEHYDRLSTVIRSAIEEWREIKRAEKKQKLIRLTELASNAGGFELDVVEEEMLVTEGALRILGLSEEAELTRKRLGELFDHDDQKKIQQTIEHVMTTSDTVSETFSYHRSDGEERILRITIKSTPTEDSATSVRGVINDITGQHEKQRQINVFDRVLRHNLRNDLNVIRGMAEMIESNASNKMAESSQRIIAKSNQLLKSATKQRDIMEVLREEPEQKTMIVESILQQVATVMRQKHPDAELTVDCPSEVTLEASDRLPQALNELVENGIIHNDCRTAEVQLTAEQCSNALHISVTDNCSPIPEMEQDVLVEPQERTPLYHGSGLGLWLVKLIVSRSNGKITFEESSPDGNTITIKLPR